MHYLAEEFEIYREYETEPAHEPEESVDLFAAPDNLAPDISHEIPRSDPTYMSLGNGLLPHPRFPGLMLLEYRTFAGALAYQPCSKDIDLRGYFNVLEPIEQDGDEIFKVARSWSCIVQSIDGLPRDLRWVLATVYNLSNEVLRPEVSDDTLWSMRAWLLHWYDVADVLFERFGYPLSAPVPDWFSRPRQIARRISPSAVDTRDSASTDHGTVVRHAVPNQREVGIIAVAGEERVEPVPLRPAVCAWLEAQLEVWDFPMEDVFDATSGSYVSPERRRTIESNRAAETTKSDLNPCASEFQPRTMAMDSLWTKCSLVSGSDTHMDSESGDGTSRGSPRYTSRSSHSSPPSVASDKKSVDGL